MATRATASEPVGTGGTDWMSGLVAGLTAGLVVGLLIYVGFDPEIVEESIPGPFGQSGVVMGLAVLIVAGAVAGLIYAALNALEVIDNLASTSRTGGLLGLVYGLILWGVAIVVVPFILGDGADGIGDYAVTAEGLLGFVLLGVIIGFLYLLIPVLRVR